MNKIYINDNYENQFLCCNSLSELAIKIKKALYSEKDCILFIDVNFKFKTITTESKKIYTLRTSQTGIELLIWLRLKEVMNHCVLHSFETTHALLNRKPENLIATSKGTSFVQMPEILKEFKTEGLEKKLAEEENVKQTLKAAFNNTSVKHRLANVYGLWFLFNTHNKYFPKAKLRNSIFPTEFTDYFDEFQLSISDYMVTKNHAAQTSASIVTKIEAKLDILKNRKPRILYVDDKADLGWGALINKMIFQETTNPDFQVHVPKKSDFQGPTNFKSLVDVIKDKIYNNGKFVDCLLLDLRLADEEGEIDNLDSLSGIRLLKAIHDSHPSLPVILTTASNKAKSIKKVIDIGAEGLWTKPGLDDVKEDEFYLLYYLELLNYVEASANKYNSNAEKHIVKAEFELAKLKPQQFIPKQFSDIDVILTDTTIWAERGKSLVQNHKSLLLLSSGRGKSGKRFIVINDVLSELFIHSQDSADKALQKSCAFSIRKIQEYKELNWIGAGFLEVANAIQEATNYKVEDLENGSYVVVSTISKVHSCHQNKVEANNEVLKKVSKQSKVLHADDTFKMLISYFLEQGKNVLFIANDVRCQDEILKTLQIKFGTVNDNYAIPAAFNKINDVLKVNHKSKNFCLIITGDVMNNICFTRKGNFISTFELPIFNSP